MELDPADTHPGLVVLVLSHRPPAPWTDLWVRPGGGAGMGQAKLQVQELTSRRPHLFLSP